MDLKQYENEMAQIFQLNKMVHLKYPFLEICWPQQGDGVTVFFCTDNINYNAKA